MKNFSTFNTVKDENFSNNCKIGPIITSFVVITTKQKYSYKNNNSKNIIQHQREELHVTDDH